MKKGLIALAISAAAATAGAADWQPITMSSDQNGTYEMDFASVARVDASTRKAWFKEKLVKPEWHAAAAASYSEGRYLIYFRCASKTSATAQMINYNAAGKTVYSRTIPADLLGFSDVIPDTVGEVFLATACAAPLPPA